ncbi:hypothetical protein Godav_001418 [Gossypium davidsonii]|uniref:Uncharacterized protein n=1 Tax=Gossypium davidsonii TaxID=34287 RepID=A0A7J8T3W3_GOSDV|nr:hypothetical protein [Gossypium davidsonii]
MLTALENRVGNLKESVGEMNETLELVEGRTDRFDSMEEQLSEFMLDSLGVNTEKMNGLVNSTVKKLVERDDTLKDMQQVMDVPKPEEFKGARSARDVDNFLWEIESTNKKRGGNAIGT